MYALTAKASFRHIPTRRRFVMAHQAEVYVVLSPIFINNLSNKVKSSTEPPPVWQKLLLSTDSKEEVEHVVSAMRGARAKWTFEEGICLFALIGKWAATCSHCLRPRVW